MLERAYRGETLIVPDLLTKAGVRKQIEDVIASSFSFLDADRRQELQNVGLDRMHEVVSVPEILRANLEANRVMTEKSVGIARDIVRVGLEYEGHIYIKKQGMTRYFAPYDVLRRHEMTPEHRSRKCCTRTMPGGVRYHGAHRDGWWADADNGVNLWGAVTKILRGNTMVIFPDCWEKPIAHEGTEIDRTQPLGRQEFFEMDAGDLFLFSGRHVHGSVLNVTDRTRVAVTFRVCLSTPLLLGRVGLRPRYFDSRFLGTPLEAITVRPSYLSSYTVRHAAAYVRGIAKRVARRV